MSRAFIRENDEQWLNEVSPTISALIVFLTRENNGIPVYEQKNYVDAEGREIYLMSNGLSYTKDEEGRWKVIY